MPRGKKTTVENKTKTEAKSPTLTPEEQAIAQRVDTQDTDWFTIREDEIEDYSLQEDPYKPPPEAVKMQNEKKYAFRWCERTPARIDQLTKTAPHYRRWALVTKTTLPELGKYVDPVLGCIPRDDQALLFRPWYWHAREKEMKQARIEAQYNSGSLDGKKQDIQDRDEDVEVFTGEKYKIGGKDEVMQEEGVDFLNESSGADLGDLVVEE